MNAVNEDSIECLAQNVEAIDELLLNAEQQLKKIGQYEELGLVSDESAPEYSLLMDSFNTFSPIDQKIDIYRNRFTMWSELDITVYQKSEVTRSLGQIKRLTLVTRNILRICRKVLGFPDPEREQEELQMQLMMMGQQFK
ncbi:hypothetical protein [Agarilytica rhodophyticola]|uniref:hypothetical protein n=1 Tax=Agarilytica rhodophyticola TaxID=1737490 RepID=UPI000B3422CD|nr:hypothetical protein [Agarilytica rhodophyticola]